MGGNVGRAATVGRAVGASSGAAEARAWLPWPRNTPTRNRPARAARGSRRSRRAIRFMCDEPLIGQRTGPPSAAVSGAESARLRGEPGPS
jgi:hypothetical protein